MRTVPILALFLALFSACNDQNTDNSNDAKNIPTVAEVKIETIPPPLDTFMFNSLALKCFFNLSKETGGEFYYKTSADAVHETIIEVINDHGRDGSDILFIIDKTGSMSNDIEDVRKNLNIIINSLSNLKNIRLGIAAYGDRNVDGPQWWAHSDLSEDFTPTRNFINKLKVSDGGDYPESVYDAIVNSIDQSKWRPDAKKMILVIGDAPSLEEDSLTQNSRADVLKVCAAEGIKANIFPILVTTVSAEDYVKANAYSTKFIQKIFPNPSKGNVNIELVSEAEYLVTLLDNSGKTYYNDTFNGKSFNFEIPANVANGLYYLRILSKDYTKIHTEKLQLQR